MSTGSSTSVTATDASSSTNGVRVSPAARNAASIGEEAVDERRAEAGTCRDRSMPSAVTSGGVCITREQRRQRSAVPSARDGDAEHDARTRARRRRGAPPRAPRRSPWRRAATAVSPTPTISASEMIIQIQKSDVDTAASAAAPMRVPTQNASTDENSVISSDDATAGSATRRIVARSESETRCAASPSPVTATGAIPSCVSTGSAVALRRVEHGHDVQRRAAASERSATRSAIGDERARRRRFGLARPRSARPRSPPSITRG